MKRLRTGAILMLGVLIALPAKAQIGKELKAFRNNEGVTVTLITPSLYTLYKKEKITPGAEEVLNNLEEINVLHADLQQTRTTVKQNMANRLEPILNNESKYIPVKSYHGLSGKELIFASEQNGQINSLVLWSENDKEVTIIELKGKVLLDKVPLLGDALNIRGMEKLQYIHVSPQANIDSWDSFFEDVIPQNFHTGRDSSLIKRLFGSTPGRITNSVDDFWGDIDDFFNDSGSLFDNMFGDIDAIKEKIEKTFGSFSEINGTGYTISNGLEIIRENGKTRFKVNATNSEVYYLIDGVEYAEESLTEVPEDIATIRMVTTPDNPGRSYVIINSLRKQGSFISYSNGILKYSHNKQEYVVNTEKLTEPALIINDKLTYNFSIDPADIIQIRPATELEKSLLQIPSAQTIIVTR